MQLYAKNGRAEGKYHFHFNCIVQSVGLIGQVQNECSGKYKMVKTIKVLKNVAAVMPDCLAPEVIIMQDGSGV